MGIKCNDYVLLASDTVNLEGIIVVKVDDEKLQKLGTKLVMAVAGHKGDKTMFTQYVAKNLLLYKMRNGYEMRPHEAAHFTRKSLIDFLKSKSCLVNLLIAGYDDKDGPQLFYMDYLAALADVNYAAHGYGALVSLPILDRYYQTDMSVSDGCRLLENCVQQVQKRLMINLSKFKIQVIDKDGVRDLPNFTQKLLVN